MANPAHRRPATVLTFNHEGKVLRLQPNSTAHEQNLSDLLRPVLPTWLADLEMFPGPLGRAQPSTTEPLMKHLEGLAASFAAGDNRVSSLEPAVKFPKSVALACHFVRCLMGSGGKVQTAEFWKQFGPCLAAAVPQTSGQPTPLQKFSSDVAHGQVLRALEQTDDAKVWPHALILAQLLAPEVYDKTLLRFSTSLKKPAAATATAAAGTSLSVGLTEAEAADPCVQALPFLYEVLGSGRVPECTSKDLLDNWQAYLSVCSTLCRPGSTQPALGKQLLESMAAGLANHGDIFAAHVCYLLSGDRKLDAVDAPASVVCLIGVEHRHPQNFTSLVNPLSMQLSEAFEYAIRCGDADALFPTIQPFKLAHAMLLADVGLVDKARKYMTMLQAFVKAVPHSRLSDAFRSSMREFNELLNPHGTSHHAYATPPAFGGGGGGGVGAAGMPSEGPKVVGRFMKDWFRGIAETTGLAVKATPPPALLGDEDEDSAPTTMSPPAAASSPPP